MTKFSFSTKLNEALLGLELTWNCVPEFTESIPSTSGCDLATGERVSGEGPRDSQRRGTRFRPARPLTYMVEEKFSRRQTEAFPGGGAHQGGLRPSQSEQPCPGLGPCLQKGCVGGPGSQGARWSCPTWSLVFPSFYKSLGPACCSGLQLRCLHLNRCGQFLSDLVFVSLYPKSPS